MYTTIISGLENGGHSIIDDMSSKLQGGNKMTDTMYYALNGEHTRILEQDETLDRCSIYVEENACLCRLMCNVTSYSMESGSYQNDIGCPDASMITCFEPETVYGTEGGGTEDEDMQFYQEKEEDQPNGDTDISTMGVVPSGSSCSHILPLECYGVTYNPVRRSKSPYSTDCWIGISEGVNHSDDTDIVNEQIIRYPVIDNDEHKEIDLSFVSSTTCTGESEAVGSSILPTNDTLLQTVLVLEDQYSSTQYGYTSSITPCPFERSQQSIGHEISSEYHNNNTDNNNNNSEIINHNAYANDNTTEFSNTAVFPREVLHTHRKGSGARLHTKTKAVSSSLRSHGNRMYTCVPHNYYSDNNIQSFTATDKERNIHVVHITDDESAQTNKKKSESVVMGTHQEEENPFYTDAGTSEAIINVHYNTQRYHANYYCDDNDEITSSDRHINDEVQLSFSEGCLSANEDRYELDDVPSALDETSSLHNTQDSIRSCYSHFSMEAQMCSSLSQGTVDGELISHVNTESPPLLVTSTGGAHSGQWIQKSCGSVDVEVIVRDNRDYIDELEDLSREQRKEEEKRRAVNSVQTSRTNNNIYCDISEDDKKTPPTRGRFSTSRTTDMSNSYFSMSGVNAKSHNGHTPLEDNKYEFGCSVDFSPLPPQPTRVDYQKDLTPKDVSMNGSVMGSKLLHIPGVDTLSSVNGSTPGLSIRRPSSLRCTSDSSPLWPSDSLLLDRRHHSPLSLRHTEDIEEPDDLVFMDVYGHPVVIGQGINDIRGLSLDESLLSTDENNGIMDKTDLYVTQNDAQPTDIVHIDISEKSMKKKKKSSPSPASPRVVRSAFDKGLQVKSSSSCAVHSPSPHIENNIKENTNSDSVKHQNIRLSHQSPLGNSSNKGIEMILSPFERLRSFMRPVNKAVYKANGNCSKYHIPSSSIDPHSARCAKSPTSGNSVNNGTSTPVTRSRSSHKIFPINPMLDMMRSTLKPQSFETPMMTMKLAKSVDVMYEKGERRHENHESYKNNTSNNINISNNNVYSRVSSRNYKETNVRVTRPFSNRTPEPIKTRCNPNRTISNAPHERTMAFVPIQQHTASTSSTTSARSTSKSRSFNCGKTLHKEKQEKIPSSQHQLLSTNKRPKAGYLIPIQKHIIQKLQRESTERNIRIHAMAEEAGLLMRDSNDPNSVNST